MTSPPCASSRAFGGLKRATTLIAELVRLLGRLFFIVGGEDGTGEGSNLIVGRVVSRMDTGPAFLSCDDGSTRSGSEHCRV